jgi:hypothetical protein
MRFAEIARRLTGLSTPVFGASWNPPEAEVTAARRVILFLEDRRVLYQPTEMEIPEYCVKSVLEIRGYLNSELGKLDPRDRLAQNLSAMRAACRKFLDQTSGLESSGRTHHGPIMNLGAYGSWIFCSAIGELRGVIGLHVAQIAARNGLDVEKNLAAILPSQVRDED